MSKTILLIFLIALVLMTACSEDTALGPSNDQIVVRGYIYAGEPVNDIQITRTLPLGSEETTAPPVNDAIVSLVRDGISYGLVPDAGDSGYYRYEGDDLAVTPGDSFEIQVKYAGQVTSAETAVPFPPQDVRLSANVLTIPTTFLGGGRPNDSTRVITLSWQREAASLFYVVVECIEENPVSVPTFGGPFGGEPLRRRLVFPPTNNNIFRITRFDISYYGNHIARVYRVNQEYADLYESRNQDSRDLNEPITNIVNGLGVFSAFASASVSFAVISE